MPVGDSILLSFEGGTLSNLKYKRQCTRIVQVSQINSLLTFMGFFPLEIKAHDNLQNFDFIPHQQPSPILPHLEQFHFCWNKNLIIFFWPNYPISSLSHCLTFVTSIIPHHQNPLVPLFFSYYHSAVLHFLPWTVWSPWPIISHYYLPVQLNPE